MAKNVCDILNESLYGTSADFEDFRPALLEDEIHSSHSYRHNARHRQSVQGIAFIMSNCSFKYKLLEISRLLSHADTSTIELSRTFIKSRSYGVILLKYFFWKLIECSRTLCECI